MVIASPWEDPLPAQQASFITPEALLDHWQGHRRLTRRVIDAFPEDKLFTFSVGGMRPFGKLALEIYGMAVPMVEGVVTDKWTWVTPPESWTKSDLLDHWDQSTEQLNELWKQIPPERFDQTMTAFGQYTGKVHWLLMYVIDNEVHHRGQGYVYLRALDISPPPFYER
jgi:uncharacterized damage-inducible protein DinB